MKFIFADSLDYVDPKYDFISDANAPGRKPYWDDVYPHELYGTPPYDGVLISRTTVGDHIIRGKYSEAQAMRFSRVGARKFLRFDREDLFQMPIFGDCGAFSYVKYETPPYTPSDTIEFYSEAGFTHGISVDHIILEFDRTHNIGCGGGSPDAHRRFEITLRLAEEFLSQHRRLNAPFEPIGVVQGWSPGSMAKAAQRLAEMGYSYIAIGGLAALNPTSIHLALTAITRALKNHSDIKIHLLGFAKANYISEFTAYNVSSFDTSSPLIRAFKDGERNYYLYDGSGRLDFYTAIRIPQVHENLTLKTAVKTGRSRLEDLVKLEKDALFSIRAYANGRGKLQETLDVIFRYLYPFLKARTDSTRSLDKQIEKMQEMYKRTLTARPWEACSCVVCQEVGVEVIIFRSSNRNKRRGMHNLSNFNDYLHGALGV